MGFGSQDKVVTFGEKLDISRGVSQGLVVGSTLKIETAMGGEYQLSLSGDVMSGSYIRGTTYNVLISFKRVLNCDSSPGSKSDSLERFGGSGARAVKKPNRLYGQKNGPSVDVSC